MAKYGSNSLAISIDDSAGAPVVFTQHVLSINEVEIEAILEESHSFGDAWFESLATGIRRMSDVVLEGFYDDAASTGPDVVLKDVTSGPSVASRTLLITWGGTKTTSAEVLIHKYGRIASRGTIHKYRSTLRPTGAVTEA